MNIEAIVNEKMKEAMKSGDKVRLDAMRSLRASILEFKKSGTDKELGEEEAMKILKSAAKKRKDAIDLYKKGGREELAEKEQQELDIINEFLPEQLSEEAIMEFVKSKVAETGAAGMSDMGKLMGVCMKELKDKADGSLVKQCVTNALKEL